MTLHVIGFFCEDIREEKSGQGTLIGLLPDNIDIAPMPKGVASSTRPILPKLGLFVRINFGMEDDIKPMTIKLILPDAGEIELGKIGADLISQSKRDAAANNLPIAGLIHRAVMQGFMIPGPGLIAGVVEIEDQRITVAVLNVRVLPTPQKT
jgi:hypothetical protein